MEIEDDDAAFDEIISLVGGDGRHQKLLYIFFIVPLYTIASLACLIQIFQVTTPDHWCSVPGRPDNISEKTWREMTIPRRSEGRGWSSCQQYENVMWEDENSTVPHIIDCQSSWTFDNTSFDYTIVTENKWVCHKESYAAQWISISLLGSAIGSIIFSNLADRIGRKPVVLILTLTFSVFGVIRVMVRQRWLLNTAMFISSMTIPSVQHIGYILVMEQVSPLYRSTTTLVSFGSWIIGMCLLPLIAWSTRNWVSLGLVASGLSFLHIPVQWYFNESPRWLACNGKISQAGGVLRKIARINSKELHTDIEDKLKFFVKPKSVGNWLVETSQLFQYPEVRRRTILVTISNICVHVVYFGLLYNNENMVGNPFLNFFLFAVAEIPSCFLGYASTKWLGRKLSGTLFHITSAFLIITSTFMQEVCQSCSVGILITAKAVVTAGLFCVFLQFVELYPTSHRSIGTGFSNVAGCTVSAAIPYIVQTNSYWSKLPYIIFVSFGVVGATAAYMLPETLGHDLPQTIDDVEVGFNNQYTPGTRFPLLKKKPLSSTKNGEL